MNAPGVPEAGQRTARGVVWWRHGPPSSARGPVTVCCVHGLGRSARDFAGIVSTLAPAHPCVLLDLAHHGASRPHTARDAPATLAHFAADVLSVLDAAGVGDVVLVGHSLGAAVCVEAALAAAPARVRHVVALDALLNPRVYPRQPAWLVALSRVLSQALHPLLAGLLARALLPPPREAARLADVAGGLRALPARVAAHAAASLAAWDRDAALASTTVPITLMPAAPFVRPALVAPLTPRCHVEAPVAGSHFFLLEHPREVAGRLEAIMGGLTAPP